MAFAPRGCFLCPIRPRGKPQHWTEAPGLVFRTPGLQPRSWPLCRLPFCPQPVIEPLRSKGCFDQRQDYEAAEKVETPGNGSTEFAHGGSWLRIGHCDSFVVRGQRRRLAVGGDGLERDVGVIAAEFKGRLVGVALA